VSFTGPWPIWKYLKKARIANDQFSHWIALCWQTQSNSSDSENITWRDGRRMNCNLLSGLSYLVMRRLLWHKSKVFDEQRNRLRIWIKMEVPLLQFLYK
jgi:hypothetical protein